MVGSDSGQRESPGYDGKWGLLAALPALWRGQEGNQAESETDLEKHLEPALPEAIIPLGFSVTRAKNCLVGFFLVA